MNYPFAAAIREFWYQPEKTKSDLEEAIHENLVRYMRQTTEVLFNLLDSHDTDRLIHQTGGNQDLFFQQLAMLFTMPGSPCIYYGTEIAIEGGADPDCRRCMPWDQIAQGNYAEVTEQVKQLIALRKEPAARSVEITFENNNSADRDGGICQNRGRGQQAPGCVKRIRKRDRCRDRGQRAVCKRL